MKKTLTAIIASIIALALVFVIGFFVGKNYKSQPLIEEKSPLVIQKDIEGHLAEASNLATYKYNYTNSASQESTLQIKNWNIPLTTKRFVVRYDGIISAGIDFSKVSITVEGKVIKVGLPKAEILSHEIDEESLEVLDETKNIFNPIQVEDYNAFQLEQKALCEKSALDKGLLEQATANAKLVITELITGMNLGSDYTIEFTE